MSAAAVVGVCVLAGAAVAPVLNVVIERACRRHTPPPFEYRLPRRRSEWTVVGASVALFALAGARFGLTPELAGYLLLFGALVTLSVIDLRESRLPDRITIPTVVSSLAIIMVGSTGDIERIRYALVGMVAYFVALLTLHLLYPKGLGFGDVKLAAVMGLYLGWLAPDASTAVYLVLLAFFVGCVVGACFALAAYAGRRHRGAFPFAPALALSCAAVILSAEPLTTGSLVPD